MDKTAQEDSEEQEIARLLRAAGPRKELPLSLQKQWEKQFRANLEPALRERKQRQLRNSKRIAFGLCASVALFAMVFAFTVLPPPITTATIRISQINGQPVLHSNSGARSQLHEGQRLSEVGVISTADHEYVALSYNGYDLRLNSNTRLAFIPGGLVLQAGEIYASDVGAKTTQALLIETPHGSVRDIGTQFTVSLTPQETVTRVRRGAVVVDTGTTQVKVLADEAGAALITMDEQKQVRQSRAAPSGADWQWIYHSAKQFELEGSSVLAFLQWSTTETGLQLKFANQAARIYAETTLLHGDLGALDPEGAVSPVLTTTDLQAKRVGDSTMVVSLSR